MEQSEHSNEELVFIPLLPGKRKRMGMMISTAMAGFILILSSITLSTETIGALLLKIFSITAALAIIMFSVMEFKKPGSNRWLGTDMISVLSGLLIIAQGAIAYQPLKDFQPAHMLFLAGSIFIFKGVMLPESKIKRGFTVTDTEIIYTKAALADSKIILRDDLKEIKMVGDVLVFNMKDSESVNISLKGAGNQEEIFERLISAQNMN